MKKIALSILALIITICLVIDGLYIYYEFFDSDLVVGINYIGQQTAINLVPVEDLSEEEINEYEERWFIHAQYFDNSNDNGIELQELKFNYFTDWSLTEMTYRSSGMQYQGDYEDEIVTVSSKKEADEYVSDNFYYYDTTDDITYSGGLLNTQLNRNNQFIIRIEDNAYGIRLDKTETYTKWNLLGFIPVRNTIYYDYSAFFDNVFDCIKQNDYGYGSFYLKDVPLSNYFTIREYNELTGKFEVDDVSDIVSSYSVMKIDYYPNGFINARQSLFNMYEGDSRYGVDEEIDSDYWQANSVYNFTEDDFSLRYSNIFDGYLVSMPANMKNFFLHSDNFKINVELSLFEENIVGLDVGSFDGISLNSLSLVSPEIKDFYLLPDCLSNTGLTNIGKSVGLNLIYSDGSIDNLISEVII